MHYHLAQVNIGRMIAPFDSPLLADFVEQIPVLNALADQSDGFVWRLDYASDIRILGDPNYLINASVWESVEALKKFTYATSHTGVLRDRTKWFERPTEAHLALWWIPAGHIPTAEEFIDRLFFRREHGDTPAAFGFTPPFEKPDAPASAGIAPGLDLNSRLFIAAANTPNGDVDGTTLFRYRQQGDRIWATYDGGSVRFGSLVARGDAEGCLDMRYQHVGPGGVFRTGTCLSKPEVLPDGRIRLHEEWQWTNGDRSHGTSLLEEVRS
jgi:hypothetical protein